MVFGELYRHGGEWKFRAVGQGYASGLRGIAQDFGSTLTRLPPPPSRAHPPGTVPDGAASAALGVPAVFALTAATGYFVAQEFAYVSADRLALTREAEAGDRKAARALKVLKHLSFMLPGAHLGITVTGLIVGFIAEPSVSALLKPALSGLAMPDAAVTGNSVVLAFVGATVVQMGIEPVDF